MVTQLAFPEPEDPVFGPVIYSYTRAQALSDGVLVDVTETAKETGFKLPVAITAELHCRLTPTRADQALGQDYDGRLWEVLWLSAFTFKLADRGTKTVLFTATLLEADLRSSESKNTDLRLRAVCDLGDDGKPVITIGFPEDF
jgi:hypothetical protein